MPWAGIGAALVGGAVSAFGARAQNRAAQRAAREQMAFQKEASQHQYQWAMEDMRKAGLNPMLAYQQGGSGNLGGSSYTPQNVGEAGVRGASASSTSALNVQRTKSEILNIDAQAELTSQSAHAAARENYLKDDYYMGPLGTQIHRQELRDIRAGQAGVIGTGLGMYKNIMNPHQKEPPIKYTSEHFRPPGPGRPAGKWYVKPKAWKPPFRLKLPYRKNKYDINKWRRK